MNSLDNLCDSEGTSILKVMMICSPQENKCSESTKETKNDVKYVQI